MRFALHLVFVLFFLPYALALGQEDCAKSIDDLYEEGKIQYRDGSYQKAVNVFQKAVDQAKDCKQASQTRLYKC
jgi:outer membrane protein assembly factor BamD (BamD/ComL family)